MFSRVSSFIPSKAPGTSINCVKSIPTLSNSTISPSQVHAKGLISKTPPIITLLSAILLSLTLTTGVMFIIAATSAELIAIVSLITLSVFSIPIISWYTISFLCFLYQTWLKSW